jgi:uncharacterized membrane protein
MKSSNLSKRFVTGIVLFIPLWITLYIIWIFVKLVSNISSPFIKTLFYIFSISESTFLIRIISFLISLLLIYLLGWLTDTILGKKILKKFEYLIFRIPLVNDIYLSIKKLINFFIGYKTTHQDSKVVIIEYPRQGVFSFGIATIETKDKIGVFVPSTPNPTTGYLVFLPKQEVKFTKISVEEALKIIVSGGIITGAEEEIKKYL